MRIPTAEELLNIWEYGLQQGPIQRALRLLGACSGETSIDPLAKLSIGSRDARLFQVRELLFGSRINSVTICPACSDRLEWESEVADLSGASSEVLNRELSLETESHRLRFRLPNSEDLIALATDSNTVREDMRKCLIERCLIDASDAEGTAVGLANLPEHAVRAMIREMEQADPQSNIRISLTCPACGNCWEAVFDIVSFLWAEFNSWAERILRSVHRLADAYGWREADILAMSPVRRQIYLQMVGE